MVPGFPGACSVYVVVDVVAYLSPDKPEEPEEPVVPLVPEDPLVPVVPLVPLVPLDPVVPLVPLVPLLPSRPVVPLVPAVPLVPVVPLVPELPLVPVVPEDPEVPVVPLDPEVPVDPLVPLVPDDPDVPLVPLVALVPLVPEVPDVADEPEVPVVPLVPLVPLVPEVPEVLIGAVPNDPSPLMYCKAVPIADIPITPDVVIGLFETANAGGTLIPTEETVPGVYPSIDIMSPAVIGDAAVTSPFAFTANFNGVITAYGLGLTFCNINVIVDCVNPVPNTSPMKVIDCGAVTSGVVVRLVTSPLAFTVTTGIKDAAPKVPGFEFTVFSVKGTAPGPVATPSPERAVM
tara:strand:- start:726 stop:1763 length:1038 start_codon:yes stop_codon:yes gene_type:complete